ncbi:hypothetical protein D3C72_1996130 [compost metagenome]
MKTNPMELTSTTEKVARNVSVCMPLLRRILSSVSGKPKASSERPTSTRASSAKPAPSSQCPRPTVSWRRCSTAASAHNDCSPMVIPTRPTRAAKLSINMTTLAKTSAVGASSSHQRMGRP